jgi:hypothetical protein
MRFVQDGQQTFRDRLEVSICASFGMTLKGFATPFKVTTDGGVSPADRTLQLAKVAQHLESCDARQVE